MCKAWLSRCTALFFAVVIAAGGSGLPILDAAFHHLRGPAGSTQLVNPSSSPAHDAVCTLGVPVSAAVAASAFRGGALISAPECAPAPLIAAAPRSGAPLLQQLPRAPPPLI